MLFRSLSCVSCCATSVEKEVDENDGDEENDTFELLIPNPGKLEEPQENLTIGTSSSQEPVQADLGASSQSGTKPEEQSNFIFSNQKTGHSKLYIKPPELPIACLGATSLSKLKRETLSVALWEMRHMPSVMSLINAMSLTPQA